MTVAHVRHRDFAELARGKPSEIVQTTTERLSRTGRCAGLGEPGAIRELRSAFRAGSNVPSWAWFKGIIEVCTETGSEPIGHDLLLRYGNWHNGSKYGFAGSFVPDVVRLTYQEAVEADGTVRYRRFDPVGTAWRAPLLLDRNSSPLFGKGNSRPFGIRVARDWIDLREPSRLGGTGAGDAFDVLLDFD